MVTMCGDNFGFDKTESFKASVVTVEVAGAPCKLARQDINRYVWVCLFVPGSTHGVYVLLPCPCVLCGKLLMRQLLHVSMHIGLTFSHFAESAVPGRYLKSHL